MRFLTSPPTGNPYVDEGWVMPCRGRGCFAAAREDGLRCVRFVRVWPEPTETDKRELQDRQYDRHGGPCEYHRMAHEFGGMEY
jgi:hypothetical protein